MTGQEKTEKGDGCCPIGQKPKADGTDCEPKEANNDRIGRCPDNTVLDPKHGWDPKPVEAKCQIDDEKDCPKPKVPQTRTDGTEMDTSIKIKCGELDPDESKRPKCNPKTQYTHVEVDDAGKATQSCRITRKYIDRKKGKPTQPNLRAKIRDLWEKAKPENEKRSKERQENLDKLKKLRAERDQRSADLTEKTEENEKKKERIGKCNPLIALLLGAASTAAQHAKREEESPYEWTSDYFDEEFISSDDRLNDWPPDLKVDQISTDVDEKKWLKKWNDDIDERRQSLHNNCNFVGKRSLERRCSQKRSLDGYWFDLDDNLMQSASNNVTPPEIEDYVPAADLVIVPSHELEKRNIGWLLILTSFGTRVAQNFVSRATAAVAARSIRLQNLLKAPDRLFQIAKTGQGTKAGSRGMQNAQEAVRKDKNWLECLKEGIP